MHEAGEVVAVALDGPEVVDRQLVGRLSPAAVLVVDRHGEDLDHDLRHLAGTLAASTGASTKEVMYRLGHATHQAALRYQHATRQRDRAIAAALDELIGDRDRSTSTS